MQRSQEIKDPIDKFSNIWRAFNNLYFSVKNQSERDKICYYLEDKVDEELAEKVVGDYKDEFFYLVAEPITDMRGNGRNTASHNERFHDGETYLDKLKELFMVVYQVRCNLEYGQKSLSRA